MTLPIMGPYLCYSDHIISSSLHHSCYVCSVTVPGLLGINMFGTLVGLLRSSYNIIHAILARYLLASHCTFQTSQRAHGH
jgi:hypothetical protein